VTESGSDRHLRIAVVHSYYSSRQPSGENVVVDLQIDALHRAGHEVELIARRTGDLEPARTYPVAAALRVASGRGASPRDRIAAFEPDVVHVHNLFPNWGRRWHWSRGRRWWPRCTTAGRCVPRARCSATVRRARSAVARFHNVYGPNVTWTGGREKAPAAVSRKVAEAVVSGRHEIEIWGDGEQTRSFMYVDDCVKGSQMIMAGDSGEPVNLGSSELVSINQLVDIVEKIAGITCTRNYKLDAPQGVRGRNSDNSQIVETYGWEPSIALQDGMERTYRWVYDEVKLAQG
jgi:hypothetical protein